MNFVAEFLSDGLRNQALLTMPLLIASVFGSPQVLKVRTQPLFPSSNLSMLKGLLHCFERAGVDCSSCPSSDNRSNWEYTSG